jgi:hypothetical protein
VKKRDRWWAYRLEEGIERSRRPPLARVSVEQRRSDLSPGRVDSAEESEILEPRRAGVEEGNNVMEELGG